WLRRSVPSRASELHVDERFGLPASDEDEREDGAVIGGPADDSRSGGEPVGERTPLVEDFEGDERDDQRGAERMIGGERVVRGERGKAGQGGGDAPDDGQRLSGRFGAEEDPGKQDEMKGEQDP